MRRSEQREHIFKLLFMTQFNSENEMSDQVSMYFDTLGELEEKDQEAIQNKYQHILEHLDEIDQILNEYSRGWKTTRMNRVDLTALRLAVYEMKMDEEVPVGVAINEAVELAKLFGGKTPALLLMVFLEKSPVVRRTPVRNIRATSSDSFCKDYHSFIQKDGKASKIRKILRERLKKAQNNKNEKYFFSGLDQSLCQEYVYTGFLFCRRSM